MTSDLSSEDSAWVDLPAPPYPNDVAAGDWSFDIEPRRLTNSDTWAIASKEQRPWLLMLWFDSWLQVPCGSLAPDDATIAGRIGLPLERFREWRDVLMRGWWQASTGRWFHPVLTERVLGMLRSRSSAATRAASHRAGSKQRGASRVSHSVITRDAGVTHAPVPPHHGEVRVYDLDLLPGPPVFDCDLTPGACEMGSAEGKSGETAPAPSPAASPPALALESETGKGKPEQPASKPKRALRKCPDGFALSSELRAWAAAKHPFVDLALETEKFRDHTFSRSISDWPGAWRNWIRRTAESPASPLGGSRRHVQDDPNAAALALFGDGSTGS